MNRKSIFLLVMMVSAVVLMAFQSASAIEGAPLLQDDPTPVVGVTVVLLGSTAAPEQAPVTSGIGINTLLIIGVLVIAGTALLLALVALMRRPAP